MGDIGASEFNSQRPPSPEKVNGTGQRILMRFFTTNLRNHRYQRLKILALGLGLTTDGVKRSWGGRNGDAGTRVASARSMPACATDHRRFASVVPAHRARRRDSRQPCPNRGGCDQRAELWTAALATILVALQNRSRRREKDWTLNDATNVATNLAWLVHGRNAFGRVWVAGGGPRVSQSDQRRGWSHWQRRQRRGQCRAWQWRRACCRQWWRHRRDNGPGQRGGLGWQRR